MKSSAKIIIFVLLALLVLGTTACGGAFPFSRSSPSGTSSNFYSGSQGVVMRFSDAGSPPGLLYFYEDDMGIPYDDDNTFFVSVDVHNVGASWTRGGLYVSGYDPNMILIDEIDIPRINGWGSCGINVGSVATQGGSFWESVGFMADCQGVGGVYKYGEDMWGVNIQNLGNAFSLVSGKDYTNEWWSNVGVAYDNSNPYAGGQSMFSLNLGLNTNYNYLNHGRGMLVLLAGLSFSRYNGQEYLLAPDDYDYPGGEQTTQVFTGHIVNWPRGLDRANAMPFLVTNCYVYTTYASPTVCIDPDPFSEARKVCYPKKITFNGGNGAPLAITSIEQENTRQRVYFTLNLKNIGSGQIFDMMRMEDCSPYSMTRLSTQHFNKVYMVDVRIGEQHLYCTPERGKGVRLNDRGEGQVRCIYDMEYYGSQSAYETQLVVEVAYGYTESMERRTTIKRVV